MRGIAQKIASRALRQHRRKTERIWEIVVPGPEIDMGVGRQKARSIEKVQIYPVEELIGEREAAHYSLKHRTGDRKLLISGIHDLSLMTKLLCDDEEVNIIRMPENPHAGANEYHVLFVNVRSENQPGDS